MLQPSVPAVDAIVVPDDRDGVAVGQEIGGDRGLVRRGDPTRAAPRSCRRRELTLPSPPDETRSELSGENAIPLVLPWWTSCGAATSLPVAGSTISTFPFSLPTATRVPSGANATMLGHSHREAAAPDHPARHQINQRPAVGGHVQKVIDLATPDHHEGGTVVRARRQPRERTTDLNRLAQLAERRPIQQHSHHRTRHRRPTAAVESAVVEVQRPDCPTPSGSQQATGPGIKNEDLTVACYQPRTCLHSDASYHNCSSARRRGSASKRHRFPV